MMRRFVLVGLMVLARESMRQIIIGTLLSAIFLLFQVSIKAWVRMRVRVRVRVRGVAVRVRMCVRRHVRVTFF